MKRLLCLAVCFFVFSAVLSAEQISVTYTFERPSIERVRIAGEEFDEIVMPNAPNCGNKGEPSLPGYPARILLPYGTEIDNIRIEVDGREYLGGDYYIKPVQQQYRLSEMPTVIEASKANEAIYASDDVFPQASYQSNGVQIYRGYSIACLKLQPVEYFPLSGDLYYIPRMTVTVETKASDKGISMFRGFAEDDAAVRGKVDNADLADSYFSAPKNGAKAYDLLILTTASLAASFEPLKAYHDSTGILTEIHTTTEVGSSSPDNVRNYIRDRYLNDGIQFVIIGADDDIIAAKDLYVQTSSGGEVETAMPADIYFACLDGTYNYDGDSRWGEPTDGDGGGDVDLIAEVSVGRASVGNTTEAARFVNKTLTYVMTSGQYLQDVILVGEHLGFGGEAEYANFAMDELVDGITNDGYTTVGIPSDIFTIDKLYDYDWPGHDWPQSELVSRINSGRHIINHLGHGDNTYAMKMYNSDVLGDLTNTDLSFVYSQTCLAGHFDGTDCWAEAANILTDHGAFAVIMNARYGFGEYNSTDGASQRFNREFWDAVFNPNEGKAQIGPANHDSKEDNLYRVNDECMRWCYYELNLFGDPTISFRGVEGLSFAYAEGIPEIIYPGQETQIDVTVAPVGDGIPVSGTGTLYYSVNGGSYTTVSMTEVLTNEYTGMLPALYCGDTLRFYVSAEEQNNGIMYDINPGTPHIAIPATGVITVFADDFETDQGWVVSGGQWARGIPTGGGGEYGSPDPTSGHTDPNVFGYNLNGDYTSSMPEYHITSPAFDCSGLSDVKLNFWRWLGVEQPSYDHAYIRVSTNGTNWTTIWENGGTIEDNAWTEVEHDISAIADGQPTVYLRFTMGTSDGSWVYCGWNIDDLEVTGLECGDYGLSISTADLPDWTVENAYSEQLTSINGVGQVSWSDKNGDLAGTGLVFSSTGLLSGTPISTGTITFIAEAVDEEFTVAEKELSFTINGHVAIATTTLPEWTAGHPYNQQLAAGGGTGVISWLDRDSDLSGTGLELSTTGQLTGTAVSGGTISFTAEASDAIGDIADQALSIVINDALAISTESIPGGRIGGTYTTQLVSTGGTGNKGWSEIGANLSSYGLTLYTNGQISGTPTAEGDVSFTARVMDAIGSSASRQYTLTIAPQLHIITNTVPNWTVGIAYSYQLSVMGVIGAIDWQDKNDDLNGTGLSLSATGILTGVVADADTIVFTALATDVDAATDEKIYTIVFNPVPVIATLELPDWTVSIPYSQQLVVAGGTHPLVWSDKNGDLAGSGLTLSSGGLVSGTPTMFGEVGFTARVTDNAGATAEQTYSFTINSGVIIVTAAALPAGEQGEAYNVQLSAEGGTGTLTWIDKNGDLGSTGLTLSSDGIVSGTPTVFGVVTFTGKATDAIGASAERPFTITVNQALVISTEVLPSWTIDIPYSQQLIATGGSGAKNWSDKNNDLDGSGLALSSEGMVTGTPVTAGDISFIAVVADDKSTIEKPFAFTINPHVLITTESLPEAKLDSTYSFQLDAVGGTGTKIWADRDAILADYGLTIDANGLISGTATAGGVIDFVVTATDVCGCIAEDQFTLTIKLPYVCGDANGDEEVNVGDAVYLISYAFRDGPAPSSFEAADANGDGDVNVADAVFLISYAFRDGPAPQCE